jgi:hypothetical protein
MSWLKRTDATQRQKLFWIRRVQTGLHGKTVPAEEIFDLGRAVASAPRQIFILGMRFSA